MRSFGLDIERNKRGQTSRPVVGTEKQTSCDMNAGSSSSDNVFATGCNGWIDVPLERWHYLGRCLRFCSSLSNNINLLLHENLS